ncbi:hypothetical protein DVH24_027452 [Malus domestica]|uniref:Uncharacterized protein n=1 Tax=Malus domestica TaxID=3750 RepID=A0A498HBV6_MALDO|nr:hypothetical protein DVH24_027452 [Malus domestica]
MVRSREKSLCATKREVVQNNGLHRGLTKEGCKARFIVMRSKLDGTRPFGSSVVSGSIGTPKLSEFAREQSHDGCPIGKFSCEFPEKKSDFIFPHVATKVVILQEFHAAIFWHICIKYFNFRCCQMNTF